MHRFTFHLWWLTCTRLKPIITIWYSTAAHLFKYFCGKANFKLTCDSDAESACEFLSCSSSHNNWTSLSFKGRNIFLLIQISQSRVSISCTSKGVTVTLVSCTVCPFLPDLFSNLGSLLRYRGAPVVINYLDYYFYPWLAGHLIGCYLTQYLTGFGSKATVFIYLEHYTDMVCDITRNRKHFFYIILLFVFDLL